MIRDTHSIASNTPKKSTNKRHGFTIIELIVVIAVIAILAAITVVGYGAWRKQTLVNQVKSDLTAVAGAMESARTFDNKYPTSVPSTVASSDSSNFVGGGNAGGSKYCVSKTSSEDASISYYIASSTAIEGPKEGDCTALLMVTTLAGSTSGFANGTGPTAQFALPANVVVDSTGMVFVADYSYNRIRKVTPAGVVTVFAGSTGSGNVDGTGAAARFANPYGLAIDSADTIYVADTSNSRIRKVTSDGVVTTLAGSTNGSADGNGSAAQFYNPRGVAVDSTGVVYVADTINHRIRKITPAGDVTTFAGSTGGYADGNGTAARFSSPWGMGTDASGNVYVADMNNHRIRKITPAGDVTTFAGPTSVGSSDGYVDGNGPAARFYSPRAITVDASGNVYVADTLNHRIRKITPAGDVTTVAGSTNGYADGATGTAQFASPAGIAIDSNGIFYVSDTSNNRIRKIE